MNWLIILIGIVAVFVVSKLIHFKHIRHRISAIALILVALFLFSTFASVAHNNSINLKTPAGVFSAVKVYGLWLGQAFGNMKVLTMNAIRMDWVPANMTR